MFTLDRIYIGIITFLVIALWALINYYDARIDKIKLQLVACESEQQVQNAAIEAARKEGVALQQKVNKAQKEIKFQIEEQKKRATQIDQEPIIDDCTGAVKWGSKKSSDLANSWVDKN